MGIQFNFLIHVWCVAVFVSRVSSEDRWEKWWTYSDYLSGPRQWGGVNPDWDICSKGKLQSPVNLDPKILLFDPNLKHVHIGSTLVSGTLVNRGQYITYIVDSTPAVHFRGGPLSYKYQVTDVTFHFGEENGNGSEHTIDGRHTAAEIQLLGFNSVLYKNVSDARNSPSGLAMLAILVQVREKTISGNPELKRFAKEMKNVRFRDHGTRITDISLQDLMPNTANFITYEGSLTKPGCAEGVTWIIMNKPVYISEKQINQFRQVREGGKEIKNSKKIAGNKRHTFPLNHRVLRTNINFPESSSRTCSVERKAGYQSNVKKKHQHWNF